MKFLKFFELIVHRDFLFLLISSQKEILFEFYKYQSILIHFKVSQKIRVQNKKKHAIENPGGKPATRGPCAQKKRLLLPWNSFSFDFDLAVTVLGVGSN